MAITPLTFPPKILAGPLSSSGNRLILPDLHHWDYDTSAASLTSGEVGTVIYAVLMDFAKTKMETVELDASTLSVAATTGILINKRALSFMGGTTALAETAYDWVPNETYVMLGSNPPQLYTNLVDLDKAQTLTGLKTFTTASRPKLTTDANATADEEMVTKGELSRTALGTTTNEAVIVAGTAGEAVAAGEVLYLKAADGRWWKADASTITTADLVGLGVAQGAGTAGASVTGGILKFGRDSNNTGLTDGQKQYLSDTAGDLSTSAGTVEVTLGYGLPDGTLMFKPKYDQQLTEDQQDALAGTSGTPSATNKYVTNDDTSATAAASKVVRSGAGSKIAEGYLQMTDAQATDLTDGGETVLHVHSIRKMKQTDKFVSWKLNRATSLDTILVGASAVNRYETYTQLDSTNTATQHAGFEIPAANIGAFIDWDNSHEFRVTVKLSSAADQDVFFGLGNDGGGVDMADAILTDRHIAFLIKDGTLYASVADGTTQTRSVIAGITLTDTNDYRIEFTAVISAKFYVNGTLGATLTTNLPTGATGYNPCRFLIETQAAATKYLYLTNPEVMVLL